MLCARGVGASRGHLELQLDAAPASWAGSASGSAPTAPERQRALLDLEPEGRITYSYTLTSVFERVRVRTQYVTRRYPNL